MTFPFDWDILEKLMKSGMSQQQAHDIALNILHESSKQKTLTIDKIEHLPVESTDKGDIIYETLSGRTYMSDGDSFVPISQPQLAGAAPVQNNPNPFNGKGKSYGAHVSSTWGNANGHVPDWESESNYF